MKSSYRFRFRRRSRSRVREFGVVLATDLSHLSSTSFDNPDRVRDGVVRTTTVSSGISDEGSYSGHTCTEQTKIDLGSRPDVNIQPEPFFSLEIRLNVHRGLDKSSQA